MHLEIPRVDDLAYKVRDNSKKFETSPGARVGRLVLSQMQKQRGLMLFQNKENRYES